MRRWGPPDIRDTTVDNMINIDDEVQKMGRYRVGEKGEEELQAKFDQKFKKDAFYM